MTDLNQLEPRIAIATATEKAGELDTCGSVRLAGALEPGTADLLRRHLCDELPWNLTLSQSGKVWDASVEQQQALGEKRIAAMALAGDEKQLKFNFDIVRTENSLDGRRARDLLLDRLAEAWTSPSSMTIWRALLRRDDITGLDMMASRYRPGHFLAAHDDGQIPERVAAFVLSLSPRWLVDWGGLLLLLGERGEVEQTIVPQFNSLSVFRVPRPHSVSMVTPLATEPRLAITGWLLAAAA